MKRDKIIYYVVTALASLPLLGGAIMYFINTAEIKSVFAGFNYPTYIVIPLAILKILGLTAIWTRYSPRLKEWAYAGFFINTSLAGFAHLNAGDGDFMAFIVLVLLVVSYVMDKRVFGKVLV